MRMEAPPTGFQLLGPLLGFLLFMLFVALFLWAGWKIVKWITSKG
ncbi:hypothetical protein [Thermococcus sp.]|nr:hypothetical protein [Thermococcus sp.]